MFKKNFEYFFDNFQALKLPEIHHWTSDEALFQKQIYKFFNTKIDEGFNDFTKNQVVLTSFLFNLIEKNSDRTEFYIDRTNLILNLTLSRHERIHLSQNNNVCYIKCKILALHNVNITTNGYCLVKCGSNCTIKICGKNNKVHCGNNCLILDDGNGSQIETGENCHIISNQFYDATHTEWRKCNDNIDLSTHLIWNSKEQIVLKESPCRPDFLTHFPLIILMGNKSSLLIKSKSLYHAYKVPGDLIPDKKYKFDMTSDNFVLV